MGYFINGGQQEKGGHTEEPVVSYKANGNGDILQETASLPRHPQPRKVFTQHELAMN